MQTNRGCLGNSIRIVMGIGALIIIFGCISVFIDPFPRSLTTTATPDKNISVAVIAPKSVSDDKKSATRVSGSTAVATIDLTPKAVPTDMQETLVVLNALSNDFDNFQIKFNDNRVKLANGVSGDRSVMITYLVATKNQDNDTATALKMLKLLGGTLERLDVDRVIIDIRAGTDDSSTTSVVLYYAKQDVQDYTAGKLTDSEMLDKQEK